MVEKLGNYKIESLVAEGGMARIYKAKTQGVGGVQKTVALKCLKGVLQEDDSFVQMLRDEALITVRMTHKNICQVYGLEHEGDTYFMVMEYVDGISLASLSRYLFSQNRVFPIEAAVFIAMEVCSGLSYAHRMLDDDGESLMIVHRDVNPQNICISKEGEVKLIDFGIAKAHKISQETQSGTIKGKFNYMSPEQARGERVDQRTDVFALGAVLYEMLTGHMLYPLSLDDARLRTKSRMADFVPIETYLPDIPDKLRKIVNKALTRDINQRFATSRDFLLALSKFFHDSCKVYDSLNLSMLVEKYLASCSSEKNEHISSPHPKVSLHPEDEYINETSRTLCEGLNDLDDLNDIEGSNTALINASTARRIAEFAESHMANEEVDATSVYSKAEYQNAIKSGLGTSQNASSHDRASFDESLVRSVDLDVIDAAGESTVMVKMDKVDTRVPLLNRIKNRILAMSERTLVILAITMTLILTVAIIGIATSSPEEEAANGIEAEAAEDSDVRQILIDSDPQGAMIYYGETPSNLKTPTRVSSSKGTISLKLPFYRKVDIDLNNIESSYRAKLVPLEGRVMIESTPNDATVFLNDNRIENLTTPMSIKVPMDRESTVLLRKQDYREAQEVIRWDDEKNNIQQLTINLKPE
ncbi:MAG: serine/threonine protein kinase [Proteobacteria bacterium]|nr:serine/threonine protein kinase [Pseudomonadota bacterium]